MPLSAAFFIFDITNFAKELEIFTVKLRLLYT
jgi:hypothetical protein